MSIKIEISKNVNGVNWRNVMRYQLMIVDDLGTEPREVMEFGNVYTPLIDLITTRYEEQLYTISLPISPQHNSKRNMANASSTASMKL